ncbi:DUF1474 family protein [Macrococcus capreoli]|uniref:type II toxin-antitoxin system toxin TscT n=1 Tax=Macrococcus capreoli TaxID=2982690 RepID=UPI003F42F9D6
MNESNRKIDTLYNDLSVVTCKFERLLTSVQWLNDDIFDKDLPKKQDIDKFLMAYRERKIKSELHTEVLDAYVKELQRIQEEMHLLNGYAWNEIKSKKVDSVLRDQTGTLSTVK